MVHLYLYGILRDMGALNSYLRMKENMFFSTVGIRPPVGRDVGRWTRLEQLDLTVLCCDPERIILIDIRNHDQMHQTTFSFLFYR